MFLQRHPKHAATLSLALTVMLAACGTTSTDEPTRLYATTHSRNVATVRLAQGDTPSSVAAALQGTVVAYKSGRGFAVVTTPLSSASLPPEFATRTTLEPDDRAVSATGTGVAWADGTGVAWADGTGVAWADGTGVAWADGQYAPLPANTQAWKSIRLDAAHAAIPESGDGVIIAVVDTGVDTQHPALKHRLAPSSLWRDMVDNDNLPNEVGSPADAAYGHGTAVATIAAQVSLKARILPYRVLRPDGSGKVSDVVNAVVRATDAGAHVINLSLGMEHASAALDSAIAYAESRGSVVVASSGNRFLEQIDFPARSAASSVLRLSVGSVDNAFTRSAFSNAGPGLELYAPGERIHAAAPAERLVAWTGTSMSTAVVSGAVALGLSANATPTAVATALAESAAPLNGSTATSPGVINLEGFARKLGR